MKIEKKKLKKWFNYKPFVKNGKYIEHYNSDEIVNIKDENGKSVDIVNIFSGRNRGKSFEICAKRCILRAIESNYTEHFAYVRRWNEELKTADIESYFDDKIEFLKDITNSEYDCFIAYRGKIYIGLYNEETDIKERKQVIGFYFSINKSNSKKSLQFPTIHTMLVEEVFTNENYCPNEVEKLMNLISTIKRNKDDFICFLISNTVSRVNPYIDSWSLSNMYTQKAGTIDMYKLYTGEVDIYGNKLYYLIACEYLKDALSEEELNKAEQRLNRLLNIRITDSTLSNRWDEVKQYPIITNKVITKYECISSMIFENRGFKYLARIYQVPSNIQEIYEKTIKEEVYIESDYEIPVVFIERKTTENKSEQRTCTDKAIINHYTSRGLVALREIDKDFFNLISDNRAFYSTNLLGNEFIKNFHELKRL